MLDRPSCDRLLEAVARFLRNEAMPALPDDLAFKARVAANALDLANREIAGRGAADAAELDRLRSLLGRGGTLSDLNRELCSRIAGGEVTAHTQGLAEHLWATTLDKVAIEQPGYATYRRIMEGGRIETAEEKP